MSGAIGCTHLMRSADGSCPECREATERMHRMHRMLKEIPVWSFRPCASCDALRARVATLEADAEHFRTEYVRAYDKAVEQAQRADRLEEAIEDGLRTAARARKDLECYASREASASMGDVASRSLGEWQSRSLAALAG